MSPAYSGLLASSPPTRSPAQPIAGRRAGLSKSMPVGQRAAEPEGSLSRRVSEAGAPATRGLSFSRRTPSASSLASAPPGVGRPPAGPSAVKNICVGFAPVQEQAAAPCLSPGRRETQASLLSAALAPASSLSTELFGAAAPSHGFQDLVVLPQRADDTAIVDMAPLLELQVQHDVFRSSNVVAAYAVAARAHAGQRRKSGEPVLSHLLAVASILAELGLPEDTVAAGLLHDVLCDTPTTAEQLARLLPDGVVRLVSKAARLNQLSQAYRDNTHSLEAEAMLDMLTGLDDVSALLIKLADRLHNMRTLGALARCKQVRMASETLDVFAVLANRLGAWAIKAELEDLAFKALNPEEHALISAAVADATAAAAAAGGAPGGRGLAAGIEELTGALSAAGLEVVDVSGRVKNMYGVWKKVQKILGRGAARGEPRSAGLASGGVGGSEPDAARSPSGALCAAPGSSGGSGRAAEIAAAMAQVYDLQALRVVVPAKHDCYAAMRCVEALWAPLPGRFKDYVRQRKANGYQSLHLTVRDSRGQPLEVQIRTPKMHWIAEYGFAAHWRYKESLDRADVWVERLVQWKRWVATEKLGIVDRKLRPSGSPGNSGGDAALADLAERLGLEGAASGGLSAAVAAAAAAGAGLSVGDALEEELGDLQLAPDAPAPAFAAAAASAAGGQAPAQAQQALSSSPADAKFAARFRMQPISEAEVSRHGASVLVSGPRGVAIAQLPAACTVRQLLRGGGGAGGGGAALAGVGGPAAAAGLGRCRLAVNGSVVLPSQADQVVLRSGDHVQVLEEPPLSLLGLAGPGGDGVGGFGASDLQERELGLPPQQPPRQPELVGAAAGADAGAGLPARVADAGGALHLFVPGQGDALELELAAKLGLQRVRSPALVS